MRLIYMGTPDFAVPTLERILERGHEVLAVVSQPDKPVGRKRELTPPAVKVAALARGLPVLQPRSARSRRFLEQVRDLRPEVVAFAAYGKLLPQEFLDIPPYGCLNVHASLLPRYRGAAPIQWAIIHGETVTGVSIMRAEAGLDTGPVLLQREEPIRPDDTAGTLFERLALLGADAMVEALDLLANGQATYTPQKEEDATYAPLIEVEHGRMNWSLPAASLHNLVRGLNPKPGAFFTSPDGREVKVWRTEVVEATRLAPPAERVPDDPGTAALAGKHELLVWTGAGLLDLKEVQPAGSRRITGPEYARGRHLAAGDRVG